MIAPWYLLSVPCFVYWNPNWTTPTPHIDGDGHVLRNRPRRDEAIRACDVHPASRHAIEKADVCLGKFEGLMDFSWFNQPKCRKKTWFEW